MKLVRYACKKAVCRNRECYGFLTADRVICLPSLAKAHSVRLPGMFADFIGSAPGSVEKSERLLAKASRRDITDASLPVNQATLSAPIVFPPKIICLGLNYRDHVSETGARTPSEPVIFMKPRTAIIGPN
jgi:2-keto-4-pentenoate hydratase/2-oxohepta-3-ene-1,7-dioic acid hydratase in catechol pathway